MKELKITPPEGYEIDVEHSTLDCIKFKPITKWRDNTYSQIKGYYIAEDSIILPCSVTSNILENKNVFATDKQAQSALAMAQISQIMANDKRFGGIVTDEEWNNDIVSKYIIKRVKFDIICAHSISYQFLAFHTSEQRNLFLEENEDLVRDYLML